MLQHVIPTASNLSHARVVNPLTALMNRVRLQMVYFTAKDVYSLCTTANAGDPLSFYQDPEFMRGLHGSFQRCDQSVLTPFQVQVVTDTLARAGLRVTAKDVLVPDADTVSPETLVNALQQMYTNKKRDDRAMTQICDMMAPLLPEFSTILLAQAAKLLSILQSSDKNFLARLGRRAVEVKDELSPVDLSTIIASLCFSQVQPSVLGQLFKVAEERIAELKADDVIMILKGLNSVAGPPQFLSTLAVFTDFALNDIESLDAVVLSHFVSCFVSLEYSNKGHVEIVADAVADRCNDMPEREVVAAMDALLKLGVLSGSVFAIFVHRCMSLVPSMDFRNIFPVMDVCSQVADSSSKELMAMLMDRAADHFMLFSSNMLGDILDCLATYPDARGHRIVDAFGKHVRRRMDLLGPPPLAKCIKGLSSLGYADPELYVEAAMTHIRWGIKDYEILEPILHGCCLSGPVDSKVVAIFGSYIRLMARRLTLQQVERAYRYMTSLGCTDEAVYRKMAERVQVFVKEVTPDVPQDLQDLLARAAANPAPVRERGRRRPQSHSF